MARTDPQYIGNPTPRDVYMNLDEKIAGIDVTTKVPDPPSSNGTYYLKVVKDNSGYTYSWATLPDMFPETPDTDGAYLLTRTVADGSATDSWESAGE